MLKVWKRIESARAKKNVSPNEIKKAENNLQNKEIMIDETSAVPYVVTNNFHPQPHIHVKSDRGLKFLRETLSLKKYDKNVELDPIINPESKAILHKIR